MNILWSRARHWKAARPLSLAALLLTAASPSAALAAFDGPVAILEAERNATGATLPFEARIPDGGIDLAVWVRTAHLSPCGFEPLRVEEGQDVRQVSDHAGRPNTLSLQIPEEPQEHFLQAALEPGISPLGDGSARPADPAEAGGPDLASARTTLTLYDGMAGIPDNAFIDLKNRSYVITAEVEVAEAGAEGVILAQGGRLGGWSLYLKEGKPAFHYNWVGLERTTIAALQPLPAGPATIRYEFAWDGGEPGSGGTGRLSVNGETVAEGRIARTAREVVGDGEMADVGRDMGAPASDDYAEGDNRFAGHVVQVRIDAEAFARPTEAMRRTVERDGGLPLD